MVGDGADEVLVPALGAHRVHPPHVVAVRVRVGDVIKVLDVAQREALHARGGLEHAQCDLGGAGKHHVIELLRHALGVRGDDVHGVASDGGHGAVEVKDGRQALRDRCVDLAEAGEGKLRGQSDQLGKLGGLAKTELERA